MVKQKKRKVQNKQVKPDTKSISLPHLQQDFIFLVAITILLAILLKPMLIDGLSPQGVDVVGSLVQPIKQPNIIKKPVSVLFGIHIYFQVCHNIIVLVRSPFQIEKILYYLSRYFSSVFIFYLFGAFGSYFLFRYLKMSPIISFISTIIFILMPHYKSLYTEGHMAKFRALMILPWVLFTFLYFLDKRSFSSSIIICPRFWCPDKNPTLSNRILYRFTHFCCRRVSGIKRFA